MRRPRLALTRFAPILVVIALVAAGCADSTTGGSDGTPPDPPTGGSGGTPPEPEVVEVPDTTSEQVDQAQSEIEGVEGGDFSVSFDPDEPTDPSACTVDNQDPV